MYKHQCWNYEQKPFVFQYFQEFLFVENNSEVQNIY